MENNIPQNSIIFLNELGSIQNWKREQTLGSGSFAIITLWVNTQTSDRIALKQYRHNNASFGNERIAYHERWKQEIEIMKRLKCENVVRTLDLPEPFQSLKVDTPILAMEYCSGGDLRKVLNKPYNCCGLEEKEVRQILKQISSAIEYLHSLKIIHRDLKPENIVLQPLSRGKILYKLTDLGYAKQLSDSTLANSFVGTLEYLAPELFLGVKYSAAVDNWSFGLLAYEVITGRRPFLPNHSMGEILEVLKQKKSSQHICTEVDEKGNFYFSSEISQFNNICSALKVDLEFWLRIVLEYEASKRGGQKAFQIISELMQKHVVQVFSIDTYESFSYEITERTTLDELQTKLSSNTNIPPKNQYLILPNGELPNTQIGKQIIQSWYQPHSWFEHYNPIVLYVFDYSKNLDYFEFYKSLTLPPMVEKMLLEPSRAMDYDELKLTWRNSVWVARQSIKKYQLLHTALKSCLLNCIGVYNRLQNKHHTLELALNGLFASVKVLKIFLQFNSHQSREMLMNSSSSSSSSTTTAGGDETTVSKQHKTTIDETSMKLNLDLSFNILTFLRSIYKFRKEKVIPLFERTKTVVPQFNKENFIFENFLKSSEVDASLLKKYNDILSAYDSLRKKKKEERNKPLPNSYMVNLLCDCFQQVETLMKEMFKILKTFSTFVQNVAVISRENETFVNAVEKWQKMIDELHSQSWLYLSKCNFISTNNSNKNNVNNATTEQVSVATIDAKLNDLSISNSDVIQTPEESMIRKLDQINNSLNELDESKWRYEKVEFIHLELYNFLF